MKPEIIKASLAAGFAVAPLYFFDMSPGVLAATGAGVALAVFTAVYRLVRPAPQQ